jgi:hypothetical protein
MGAIKHPIVLFVENLFNAVGWASVVIAMTIGSACILLPSEVRMPLASWMLMQVRGLSTYNAKTTIPQYDETMTRNGGSPRWTC